MADETAEPLRDVMNEWHQRAVARQNRLTKPPGSLGRLEELANRLCAIQQTLTPSVDKAAILVFAADHGICEERVNPFPQSVTRQMLLNFLQGGAAINALARVAQAELVVVDMGIIGPAIEHSKLLSHRVAMGTRNFCKEPAMTSEQAVMAMQAGMNCARAVISAGATVIGIGEMGIGNTTVASALCAALTALEPAVVCGRGTGCDDAGLLRKQDAVRRGLELHRESLGNPQGILSCLGGFEIAAMCGVCLEAAESRCAVLIDGFISTAAAALAYRMNPTAGNFLIASHRSCEPGHQALLDLLKLEPLLDLRMRLGEGTGAALAIPILRGAVAAFNFMATFESAGVAEAS